MAMLNNQMVSTTCLETRRFCDRNFTAGMVNHQGHHTIISRESLEKGKELVVLKKQPDMLHEWSIL